MKGIHGPRDHQERHIWRPALQAHHGVMAQRLAQLGQAGKGVPASPPVPQGPESTLPALVPSPQPPPPTLDMCQKPSLAQELHETWQLSLSLVRSLQTSL